MQVRGDHQVTPELLEQLGRWASRVPQGRRAPVDLGVNVERLEFREALFQDQVVYQGRRDPLGTSDCLVDLVIVVHQVTEPPD